MTGEYNSQHNPVAGFPTETASGASAVPGLQPNQPTAFPAEAPILPASQVVEPALLPHIAPGSAFAIPPSPGPMFAPAPGPAPWVSTFPGDMLTLGAVVAGANGPAGAAGCGVATPNGMPNSIATPPAFCSYCQHCCRCNANNPSHCEVASVLVDMYSGPMGNSTGALVFCGTCQRDCVSCPSLGMSGSCPGGNCCNAALTYQQESAGPAPGPAGFAYSPTASFAAAAPGLTPPGLATAR